MVSFSMLVRAYHTLEVIARTEPDTCVTEAKAVVERLMEAENPERFAVWRAGQIVVSPRTATMGARTRPR